MRRLSALILLTGLLGMAPAALAQAQEPKGPVIDVVEIAGIIDRPLANYAMERIDAAEREGDALLVFQVSSPGMVKVSEDDVLPTLVRRVRDAKVPIAVHVGPRRAHAGGGVVALAAAAHVAAVGPSATVGPAHPFDVGPRRHPEAVETSALAELARLRGRRLSADASTVVGANEAHQRGFVDMVVPSIDDLLRKIDGRTVTTATGNVRLSLPEDTSVVRFFQPGPIRRLLHTFSNPSLLFVMIVAVAMLLAFELFQPGFGVAGVTGLVFLVAVVYGFTVLPASWLGMLLLAAGFALLTFDVVVNALGVPTALGAVGVAAGATILFPRDIDALALSPWLIAGGVASTLIMFVPVLTVVRRARTPISSQIRAQLVGEPGQVRSMLNPEGFVAVDGEIWRARTEDGRRMRVGEDVEVVSIDGTLLIVRPRESVENA